MAIVKMRDMLREAEEHGYGVPAINIFNFESAKYAIRAAEEAEMPVIIQLYPGFDKHIKSELVIQEYFDHGFSQNVYRTTDIVSEYLIKQLKGK